MDHVSQVAHAIDKQMERDAAAAAV
jgi:hypothetical protein